MIRALTGVVALGALACAACNSILPPPVDVLGARHDADHPATFQGLSLKSGQIILSESVEPTSFVFMLVPERFYPFTRAGVLAIEDGEPWVYEVSGEFADIPLKARVLDNVRGEVHRVRLFDYVASNLFVEIYDPPEGADPEKIAGFARAQFLAKTKFDPYFRFDDHSALASTELLELALRAGNAKPHEPVATRFQPSLDIALKWLAIDYATALPAGLYEDRSRWVASLGQFPTRTNAYVYFAAKKELYRRFHHPDQRLGFLFVVKGSGEIKLRPEIADFVVNASHLFDGVTPAPDAGSPAITDAVRRFADATFGAAPE